LEKSRGSRTHLNATVQWTVAATSANTGGYIDFANGKMQIDSRTLLHTKTSFVRLTKEVFYNDIRSCGHG